VVAAAGVTVAEKKSFTEKREREVVQPPREMVRWLLKVETMVRRQVMRVVVAEGHDREIKKRKDRLQEN